jgi:hypothetical protein
MRWWGALVAAVLCGVGSAGAQVLWVGAGLGTTWDIQPSSAASRSLVHNSGSTPTVFVAFPLDSDTLFRIRGVDLPHKAEVDGTAVDSHLRGLTAGIDYFFPSTVSQTSISGGIGGYKLDLVSRHASSSVETWEFGFYLGMGEWFNLSRRTRAVLELNWHHTSHQGTPNILALTASLAIAF